MALYPKEKTKEISFPLGGIGTGSIGLAGNGRLRDWEIYNRPNKNSGNGFSHIMVRAERNGRVEDVRVLQGDWPGGATGGETSNIYRGNGGFGYGMGPYRGTMAGVPHFERHSFEGEFPFAALRFSDDAFPGGVELRAFNPFIPLNDKDSSLPAAFFEITFCNTTSETLDYTALFTLNNPLPFGAGVNRFKTEGGISSLRMAADALSPEDILCGELCLATDAPEVSRQEAWRRAEWFDSLEAFWYDVNKGGHLPERSYPSPAGNGKPPLRLDGEEPGTLAAHLRLAAGERKSVRFVLAWYFPNCSNYWHPEAGQLKPAVWKNYYASLFPGARECAEYSLANWERLYGDTLLFKNTLYDTSLPPACIDAVSANLSILKTATCLRLSDGSFYGFEGCGVDSGCCEGSCSHVWNYAYALPFLFPKLERSMRDLDFRCNQREDGGMSFRLMLPPGRERDHFRPCVDGQMGGVVKALRDYRLCGDIGWLGANWEAIKKSVEFAWAPTNEDRWDFDRDGVMEGRQHHTLDSELFGPSSWLNGFYLASLKAGAEIAALLGHSDEARDYAALYEKGRAWCDAHLFNGEYFEQAVDLADKALLERYDSGKTLDGVGTVDAYWDEEKGEIKYQLANGSSVDQVSAQWHANLCGLGDIFDPEKVKRALLSIYRYNFKTSSRNEFNAARVYCLDGEAGTRVCAWPEGAKKPLIPITYAEEVFCGMEYAAAAHMLQAGLPEECYALVKAVRDRFDGEKRNPWNEFECGSNYARSMASYSLIPSAGGFTFDLAREYLGFNPQTGGDEFHSFFSVDSGWGRFVRQAGALRLELLYGGLKLRRFGLPADCPPPRRAALAGRDVAFCSENGGLLFESSLELRAGGTLEITL